MTYFFGGITEYDLTVTLENKAHYCGEIMGSFEYTVLVTLHTLHNTVSHNITCHLRFYGNTHKTKQRSSENVSEMLFESTYLVILG